MQHENGVQANTAAHGVSHGDADVTVVPPMTREKYALDDLLAGITPENIHECIDFGRPVGKEWPDF